MYGVLIEFTQHSIEISSNPYFAIESRLVILLCFCCQLVTEKRMRVWVVLLVSPFVPLCWIFCDCSCPLLSLRRRRLVLVLVLLLRLCLLLRLLLLLYLFPFLLYQLPLPTISPSNANT